MPLSSKAKPGAPRGDGRARAAARAPCPLCGRPRAIALHPGRRRDARPRRAGPAAARAARPQRGATARATRRAFRSHAVQPGVAGLVHGVGHRDRLGRAPGRWSPRSHAEPSGHHGRQAPPPATRARWPARRAGRRSPRARPAARPRRAAAPPDRWRGSGRRGRRARAGSPARSRRGGAPPPSTESCSPSLRPESSSQIRTPAAQTSARASSSSPRRCSGAM